MDPEFKVPMLQADTVDYAALPVYPLDSPGMPIPGPDFSALAVSLGDIAAKTKKVGDSHVLTYFGEKLGTLYHEALYTRNFTLPVKIKGKTLAARFVPGHKWNDPVSLFGPTSRSPVMVVGKCLGREEVNKGRNFIGETSSLLVEALQTAGVPYHDMAGWYVTNLVKHADVWGDASRIPTSLIKNCSLLLEQEIRLVRPSFVLCLGVEASSWFLGADNGSVADSHGRVFTKRVRIDMPGEEPRWHEFKFMTCVHPAAIMRLPMRRDEFIDTVGKFWRMVQGRSVDVHAGREKDHKSIYVLEELRQTIDQIIEEHRQSGAPSQKIAIDCEWHGNFWIANKRKLTKLQGPFKVNDEKGETESWLRTFQFSHKPGFARCVVLRSGGPRHPDGQDNIGRVACIPDVDSMMQELLRLFTPTPDRPIRLVGHNIRADIPWVFAECPSLGLQLQELLEPDPDIERCRDFGGFDTLYALHAVNENAERKLEVAGMYMCGIPRYDGEVLRERREICKRAKISQKDLDGYGEITEETLQPYACNDVDVTSCLERELTRQGGKLDKDSYGLSSWRSWHGAQGKMTAELEMEMVGLKIDTRRAEKLTAAYKLASERLQENVERLTNWPGFNTASVQHVRTVLFGPAYAGKIDNKTGMRLDPRPESAMNCTLLGLTPIKATGDKSPEWARVVADGKQFELVPSTNKETLGILLSRARQEGVKEAEDVLDAIRNCRFVAKVLSTVLCPPDADGESLEYDDDGDMVYQKGFLSSVQPDNRVRTHFLPVDTHRVSSADPNIQNLSKRRETDLKRILGDLYAHPLRSIVCAEPGYVLVESDLSGAELLMMAAQSGSAKMLDHCLRSSYPESDERYYDIHSRVAKACFKFDGPPLKSWLEQAGKSNLRDIAKTVAFGLPYGRGDAAILRGIEETGVVVTMDDVVKVREALFGEYPELEPFFARSQARVETHGYLRTCFQSTRRFADWHGKESVLKNMQRQAGNFPIQGGIADALKFILRKFYHFPGRRRADGSYRYRLVAQIHDAVMSEVAIDSLEWYVDHVLPGCMSDAVLIYPSDLDGIPLPGREGVKLGYDYGIYQNWGEKISLDLAQKLGIPSRFWPKPKTPKPTTAA